MAREVDLRIDQIAYSRDTKDRFMRTLDLMIELMVLGGEYVGSVGGVAIVVNDGMPHNKVAFRNRDGEIVGVLDLNEK